MINQEDNENINEILKEKMKEINNMNQLNDYGNLF